MSSKFQPTRVSSRQQTPAASQRKFLLSGFPNHIKADLATKIINLGSKYLEVGEYTSDCTHIVCFKPLRSEKYLCACAAGKWVLSKDYLIESAKAGKWLKEEQYQWGIRHINDPVGQTKMALAPARWHRIIQDTGRKPFTGWKVLIMVENKKRKPSVYKRFLECGDGKALISLKKDLNLTASQFTHVLVDKYYEDYVDAFIAQGVPCVSPDYLAEYLFEEHPDISKFIITKQVKPNQCQSIATSEANSTQSSRRSSRISSRAPSPTRSQRGNASSPIKNSIATSEANSTQSSRRTSRISSRAPSPTRSQRSNASSPIKNLGNQISSKGASPARSRHSNTSSPIKSLDTKFSLPARSLDSRESVPTKGQSSKTSSPVKTEPMGDRTFKARLPIKGNQDMPTADKRMTRTKAFSAPATAAVNTPVKGSSLSPTQALNSIASFKDAAETVTKKQEKDPLSFIPYWMQVTPPRSKVSDQCALPFPKVICNVVEACIEEGLWVDAVTVIANNLSVSKFPPADILHMIMQQIMQSSSSTLASSGYHMLKSVLCLHSPMTSPSMRQVYLQSMLPPTRTIEGFEIEDDAPIIRCHWDFIDNVISNCFPKMVPVDDASQEENEMEVKSQMNNQLLLNYIVTLLEQDFNGYRQRFSDTNGKAPSKCMVSSILWPNGLHKVTSSAVKRLLSHFMSAVKHTHQNETMCIVLRLLATLVNMCAFLLNVDQSSSDMSHGVCSSEGHAVELTYEISSLALQDGIIDNIDCLQIMLTTLQPSWLKMCVCEIFLQDYDNCLVLSQHKTKAKEPLSLHKLVNYYFYLLPKATSTTENSSQESIPSPLKKTTRNPRMDRALKTLADSNTANIGGKKRKLDVVPGPKMTSPMKKRRILQINKRNAKGETQLHVACIKNDTLRLRQLLSTPGIQVNMKDFAGWTPLHEAANHGHVNCIKELLKFKAQANIMSYLDKESMKAFGGVDLLAAPAECGTTPLHDAVLNGHLDVVRLLVQSGGKSVLMAKNVAGFTPPDLAISDEMKSALQCAPKTQETIADQGSSLQATYSTEDKIPSNSCPSEELYDTVLGSPRKPKIFITAIQAEQYCIIVRYLLRAYVQVHKLAEIQSELSRRAIGTQTPLNVSHDSSFGNCSFSSPVATVLLPLVKLRDIRCKTEMKSETTSKHDDVLEQDLCLMEELLDHVTGFAHHIERIGPWVGTNKSAIVKAVILELNLLVSSWMDQ